MFYIIMMVVIFFIIADLIEGVANPVNNHNTLKLFGVICGIVGFGVFILVRYNQHYGVN